MAEAARRRLVKRSFQLTPEQDRWLHDYAVEQGFASETEALREILRAAMERDRQTNGEAA